MKDRIDDKLQLGTHKKRIENFNKKLSALSDHFDVPKVGKEFIIYSFIIRSCLIELPLIIKIKNN